MALPFLPLRAVGTPGSARRERGRHGAAIVTAFRPADEVLERTARKSFTVMIGDESCWWSSSSSQCTLSSAIRRARVCSPDTRAGCRAREFLCMDAEPCDVDWADAVRDALSREGLLGGESICALTGGDSERALGGVVGLPSHTLARRTLHPPLRWGLNVSWGLPSGGAGLAAREPGAMRAIALAEPAAFDVV